MATVPLWQLGKHFISGVLTPQAVSTAGVLTDTTPVATVSATIDSVNSSLSPETEEINAINTVRRNEVVISDGATLDLQVLKVNNATDPSPLRTSVFASDYFKWVSVEGTGGSAKTTTAYYTRGEYRDGFQGRGRQIASLQLLPVDIGSAQVVIS